MRVRRVVIAAIGLVVATSAISGGAVATPTSTSPAVVVDVHEDGNATVTVRMTFDLSNDQERLAFESIADDETTREAIRSQFRDRLASVIGAVENATGREMSIGDVSIDVSTVEDGTTGIVRLSATWTNLATREGNRLVLREPFASGFTAERRVVLHAPDSFEIVSASPEPDERNRTRAVWSVGRDLAGFEVVLAPSDEVAADGTHRGTPSGETTATGGQPGFGVVAALVAVLTGLAIRVRTEPSRER